MTAALLEVSELVVRHGRSSVVQGVDLAVEAGQVVALMGRNGVGKTTTVHALAGLLPVAGGRIRLDGADVTTAPAHRRARAGMALVAQGRRLFAGLSVHEHLTVARSVGRGRDGWSVEHAYERFPALAERRRVGATLLSGGEQQMLAIARAMVTGPRVVLMDEPSEGLAPAIVDQIGDLIGEIRDAGGTVLVVEQNLGLGLGVSDHVYLMSKGRIVADGPPAAIRADEDRMHRYLGVGAAAP